MSKNVIYCYSGTGNCLDIAKNIANVLGDTDIIMMRKAPAKTDVTDAERVGFIFPCYAGGLPGNVKEYVATIKVASDAYTFAVTSYAGYPGIGAAIINEIIPLQYYAGISHQSACIWLMPHNLMIPMLNKEEAEKRSQELTAKIAADLAAKQKNHIPSANPLNKAESRAWPMLARKKNARFTVSDACTMCGTCVSVCPKDNIRLAQSIQKVNIGTDCIGCLSCLQYCPTQAISMGKTVDSRERYHNANIPASELIKDIIHID